LVRRLLRLRGVSEWLVRRCVRAAFASRAGASSDRRHVVLRPANAAARSGHSVRRGTSISAILYAACRIWVSSCTPVLGQFLMLHWLTRLTCCTSYIYRTVEQVLTRKCVCRRKALFDVECFLKSAPELREAVAHLRDRNYRMAALMCNRCGGWPCCCFSAQMGS
jgi:hypothetical protein